MLEDGSVDYPSLRKLIDWHVAEGTNCIGVVGTTGESPTVNVEEHCEIIRVAVEQAAGRVSIMAGCGANSTHEAIELAKYAKKVGADSQLQVVPYYNKPHRKASTSTSRPSPKPLATCPWFCTTCPAARLRTCSMTPCCVWPRSPASSASRKPPATSSVLNG
jgi:hypothetical protein